MEFTEEQQMLRDVVRSTLERDAPTSIVRSVLEGPAPDDVAFIDVREGWSTIAIPEGFGGAGGGAQELAIIASEMGRAALPGVWFARTALAVPLLAAAGDGGLTKDIASGEISVVVTVDAGQPPAEPDGLSVEDGRISGTVLNVMDAHRADRFLVPAGAQSYLVDARQPAVRIDHAQLADRTRQLGHVALTDAEATLLGPSDFADARTLTALLLAADSLGVSERMLAMTVAYVKVREQFGMPVGAFQAIKHMAADMLTAVELARSAVTHAAWSVAAELESSDVHASAAKALCSELGAEVADVALACHGAIGYTWEHDLHLFFKRARANVALFGRPSEHRNRVADRLGLTVTP